MSMIISYIEEKSVENNQFKKVSEIQEATKVRITSIIEEIVEEYFIEKSYIEVSEDGEIEEVILDIILNDSIPGMLNKIREKRLEVLEQLISSRGESNKMSLGDQLKDLLLVSDLLENYMILKQSKHNLVLIIL